MVFDIRTNEFVLRGCTFMTGLNEGWIRNKTIYVSHAVFQLLTDQDDLETRAIVANQLTFKVVPDYELIRLITRSDYSHADDKIEEAIIQFKMQG
ncbi:MAG TPA: hypothetical protein VK666_27030 [Chryseolinea sp.]|nr:hypothetical protein [Chryseolinea sp.]